MVLCRNRRSGPSSYSTSGNRVVLTWMRLPRNLVHMNTTATRQAPAEIWFTTNPRTGRRRAYHYSTLAGRALPFPLAQAELAIATGASVECTKPAWVGTK